MSQEEPRRTLSTLLRQSHSHAGLSRAVEGLSAESAGRLADGFTHTSWEQVEHMRLAAEDLVSYCRDANYKDLGWPEGYWPQSTAPPSEEALDQSVDRLLAATEAMTVLVQDAEHDIYAKVPTAEKNHHHTLRAALILLDHNGYHVGQLIALRLALGDWPPV